ncbi:MAG TPA: TetR/AcrR family transcriptional regulator [Stellaceae bacterium]|nr:TetR/AcrR family transcriptional regulator [Stellaceae bacterium]
MAAARAREGGTGKVGPGRPRSAAVERAILRAAFALFVEGGVEGASIEKIARKAGVAKTSIYRRWRSRDQLLAQAIEAGRNESAPGYTTDAVQHASAADFLQLLLGAGNIMLRPRMRKLVTRLIGSVSDHPHLLEVYRETYFRPRRRALEGALRRVQAAGAIRPDADIESLADMLGGALIYRLVLVHEPGDTPEKLRAYLLRILRAAGIDLDRVTGSERG